MQLKTVDTTHQLTTHELVDRDFSTFGLISEFQRILTGKIPLPLLFALCMMQHLFRWSLRGTMRVVCCADWNANTERKKRSECHLSLLFCPHTHSTVNSVDIGPEISHALHIQALQHKFAHCHLTVEWHHAIKLHLLGQHFDLASSIQLAAICWTNFLKELSLIIAFHNETIYHPATPLPSERKPISVKSH